MKTKALFALLLVAAMLFIQVPVLAADGPTFVVESATAKAGEDVSVAISVKNNPGITSIKLTVTYDVNLTLNKVTYNTAEIGGMSMPPQKMNSPVILNWFNGLANTEGDWVFATLSFTVAQDAPVGECPVEITYNPNDVFDITETNIGFVIENGGVTVKTDPVAVTGVSLNKNALTLKAGESETLFATVAPENATNQAVTWKSNKETVATVDSTGKVTAVNEGTAVITVTTEDGEYTATCNVTVPHEHSYDSDWHYDDDSHWHECTANDGARSEEALHDGGEATCEEYAVCETCMQPYGDYAAHNMTKTEAKDATHDATGNIAYWTCDVCHRIFRDDAGNEEIELKDTILPVIPHSYGTEWQSDPDEHWHVCGCGVKADVDVHTFTWVVDKEATHDQTGLQHEECTTCAYKRNEGTVIPVTPHQMTHHDAVAATCVATGNVEYYSCSVCGGNYKDAEGEQELADVTTQIDPANHTGETIVKDAKEVTCTTDGYTGDKYCADCDEMLEPGNKIFADGHNLVVIAAKEATHTAPGNVEHWACSKCGAVFSDAEGNDEIDPKDVEIPQIPHVFSETWEFDSTSHWHECACGAKSDEAAHTYGDWNVTKEATTEQTGTRERSCSVCSNTEVEEIPVIKPEVPETNTPTGPDNGPKTGDSSVIGIWVTLLVLSGLGMITLMVIPKKKRTR